jgi:hypothetical protein
MWSEQKRYDDLERSTRDTQFQKQLLAELVPEKKQKESNQLLRI